MASLTIWSFFFLFFFALVGASWCVCKTGLSDSVLQKTLDYACGNGADCNPTHPKGSCFNPDNVRAHCNYAVNSFFQKKGQAAESCNFTGSATLTTTDPSKFLRNLILLWFFRTLQVFESQKVQVQGLLVTLYYELVLKTRLEIFLTFFLLCVIFFFVTGYTGCAFPSSARYGSLLLHISFLNGFI